MSEPTSSQQKSQNPSCDDVEIVEIRKELIEKKSRDINLVWKLTPAILYFICAITGYSTSILFHIFWREIFTDNCPLWTNMIPPARKRVIRIRNTLGESNETLIDVVIDDWRRHLLVTFKYEYHCKFFHAVCLCSCLFGVIWCMLFTRCASGIYAAQWLIIPPALLFQITFTIIVINTMHDFELGYATFVNQLGNIAPMFMNRTEMARFSRSCELVDYYLQIYNFHPNRICNVHVALQTLSWIMVLSWIGGLFFLILRIIVVNDFQLRKTTVYRMPIGANMPVFPEETAIEIPIEMRRIRKLLNFFRFPFRSNQET